MDRFITIGRAALAALALTLVVAACDDDRSPTKVVDKNPPENPDATDNPWTAIFAAADKLGGPARVTFAGANDRSFRVRKLNPGSAVPQDALESTEALCAVNDPADRHDLGAFRQCMAKALRDDVCRSGGAFVILHWPTAVAWRAYCPSAIPEEQEDDNGEDNPGTASDAATLRSAVGTPAARLG